jgi:flavin reductase (DIM6/NTAB) family NADH-FMN oxidoreductase RutF
MLKNSTVEQQSLDSSSLRRAMGRFATGIGVVTTRSEAGLHGMTANSITTVSFDPLLVLVCVSKNSTMSKAIQHAHRFAINLLEAQQEQVSNHFASSNPDFEYLPFGIHLEEFAGTPALGGVLATISCEVYQIIEAGDHDMVLGLVKAVRYEESDVTPLVYFRGKYRQLEIPMPIADSRNLAYAEMATSA